MRATRSRKKGFLCVVAAIALTLGLVLPRIGTAKADDVHTITLDENCAAFEDEDGTFGITCEVEEVEMEFELRFGWIAQDGGFSNFEASDFGGFSISMNDLGKYVVSIEDDEIMEDGFIHLYEPEYEGEHPEIVGMIDGQEVHLDAGNLPLSDVDDKNFGLGVKHEDENPDGPGPNIWWEYGPYDGQTYGGTIKLVEFCEPAWAYDENAEPGTYVNCVDIDGDYEVEGKPVTVQQDNYGGQIIAAHGVKLKFEVTPNEGFEFDDVDFFMEPEDVELNVSGAGSPEGGEFELEVPENVGINIVGYFIFNSENALEIRQDQQDDCGSMLPRILTVEADDAPDNVAFSIGCSLVNMDDEDWNTLAESVYGSADEFKEYVGGLYDAETDEETIIGLVMNKYGQIMAVNFDMSLVDLDSGEKVDYDGNGIKVTFAMSEWLGWFGEVLTDSYDGEMELLFAHIKKDGTVEYISTTHNDDDTFTVIIKSMSPFGFVARGIKDGPDNPSTDDNVNLYVGIGAAAMVLVVAGIYLSRKSTRR